jgi:hypothetical protein
MRFMVIVTGPDDAGPPTSEELAAMGRFNEELMKAGVMKGGEGLHPTRKGAKVTFSGSKRSVIDGPYAEAKEVIGGFWILETKDKAEVIEWVKKIPFEEGSVEIRQISEVEDFQMDDVSREALEKEKVWKEQLREP